MPRKTNRTDFGFTTENLNTAAASIVGSFAKDGTITKGSHFDQAQAAVEAAYITVAADPIKCGKSGIPSTTDVARLAYENFRGLVENVDELIENELPGAGALTEGKLTAFQWEWTGEGEDNKFNEVARLHVAFREIAKTHIKAMKAQKKAAESAARQAKNAEKAAEKAAAEAAKPATEATDETTTEVQAGEVAVS